MDELIHELSELCGILPEYWDISGKKHITSIKTKKSILRSINLKIDSIDAILAEINKRKWQPWKNIMESVYVISAHDQPLKIPLYLPIKEGDESKLAISWSLENESGQKDTFMLSGQDIHVSDQQWIEGIRYIHVPLLENDARDIGYYKIVVDCRHTDCIFEGGRNHLQKTAQVIITPDTCYIPPELQKGKAWGLSINLYAIRSDKNWGIGDFTDLVRIVRWIAGLKGGFVGINPLHAIPNTRPFGLSPYSPISRLFKNFIYLDLEQIPEVIESEDARALIASDDFSKKLEEAKTGNLVDYEKVAMLKKEILRNAFSLFYKKHYTHNTHRGNDLKNYISKGGRDLEYFALFLALWEHLKKKNNSYTWQEWPEEYHTPSSKEVQEFRRANREEILFYQYIQWLIDGQHKNVAEEAHHLGMSIGLYHDLAIGSVGGGSDAWCYQDVFARDISVGAPPDNFSPDGQNWGFPPLNPEKLKETGYEMFIQIIRKNMNYSGALRIDHALGMFRLFWIPKGLTPKEGAYICYPSEDLLRIIALESVRNRTAVIAEDLGTIGENVRETLAKFHMFSYKLFYFERNYPDPSFSTPDKYPDLALCAVTTHDLPTTYGYWGKRDIEMRKQLGKYSNNTLWQQQIKERERDKRLILSTLKSQGIIPADYPSEPKMIPEMTPELCLAIYQYLALTPCKLLLVSLDDIIGTLNQQNMPGTVDSYPNWVQKIPLTLEEMVLDRRFSDLSNMLRKNILTLLPQDLRR